MESSILESIGDEIIGVMSPVSICMFLVVLLVSALSPNNSSAPIRTAATLVYLESPSDSASHKLEGALLNSLVFIVIIAVATFLLVVLYYYNFTNFLKNYMRFSAFVVLGTLGGSICFSIIKHFYIPIDSVTCFLVLFNFSVVGVLSVFSGGIPIVLRQGYMVSLGVITAAWFTKLPEWTTWVSLVALAFYDLVAVLAPGGPLKLLIQLASNRNQELPALVYEARPTVSPSAGNQRSSLRLLVAGVSDSRSFELQPLSNEGENVNEQNSSYTAAREEMERSLLVTTHSASSSSSVVGNGQSEIVADEEMPPRVETLGMGNGREELRQDGAVELEAATIKGIKLGLGDFVFYSVLVGRAAMYDLMTVYACYLAIISGVGCTLILLAVWRRALPALPISIALGVLFYFSTRLLLEPFVVGITTNLIMF